jgi:Ca2+-binding RTX toxin-like protein
MGSDNDTFIWNSGDGSDTVSGDSGVDTMVFNGTSGNDNVSVSASGALVHFIREVGGVNMTLRGVEDVQFNGAGGADTITVNDLTGTDVTRLDLNLARPAGNSAPASQASAVVVNGTNGDDAITVTGDVSGVAVTGLSAQVNIAGAQSPIDKLTINGLAGNDAVDASGLAAGAVAFVADGGDGDDVLIGSFGNDTLIGGAGENTLVGGPGLDVIDPGSADSVVIQD